MSSARQRQQKRRARESRSPAVWVGDRDTRTREREAHGIRDEITFSWRLFSGLIVIALSVVMVAFFVTDFFYVRSIDLRGATYLDEGEVFRYANIAEQHVFWVDPDRVRRNILDATPLVADVQVTVGWPPDMVTIRVEEREPALLWIQAGVRVLLDIQGNVLRSPRDEEQFPLLLTVIVDDSLSDPRLPGDPVPVHVVAGALQLQRLVAGLSSLRYNATHGLGFRETNGGDIGWDVWLGTGTDMANKLSVYETLRADLASRGITPTVINVADLDAVYYCGSSEFCYE